MRAEVLQVAARLARDGQPFVLATVVRREPFSSAQPGDLAVITADGTLHGWLGGSCTAPTVKREAKAALADGQTRLLSLSPDPTGPQRPGITSLPMTCLSGATVEIFLEPVLPVPRLVVFGVSPVARAFARLGKAMGYSVDVADPDAQPDGVDRAFADINAPELKAAPGTAASGVYTLVATMGDSDEDAVTAALNLGPGYVGVVASRKRFALIREVLVDRGFSAAALDAIHNPAGLDLGARRPEEVALSVLAEIVQLRQRAGALLAEPRPTPPQAEEAIDPICGMTVIIPGARHHVTHQGHEVYFCNARCKDKFLADPAKYLQPAAAGA